METTAPFNSPGSIGNFEPALATAAESADAIRRKSISATELLSLTFRRVDLHNPTMVMGVLATCLFYGDAMITPAVTLLPAIEGLAVAETGLKPLVLPITIAILHRIGAVRAAIGSQCAQTRTVIPSGSFPCRLSLTTTSARSSPISCRGQPRCLA